MDDTAVIDMLSKLVDKVEALTTSHQMVMTYSDRMKHQIADQDAVMKAQQNEIERLRLAPKEPPAPELGPHAKPQALPESVSVPDGSTRKKFYAVARGRRVGVFTQWKDAERSVHGYSGAIHKRFRSERAAVQWLAEHTNTIRPDDASEISYDGTQGDYGTVYGDQTWLPPSRQTRPEPIVDPSLAGLDPSVGKPTELYNTSIQVESEVLKVLCPKGVTAQTRKDLMDATPDILSLPGKLGSAMND
jgi:hypothetical protein